MVRPDRPIDRLAERGSGLRTLSGKPYKPPVDKRRQKLDKLQAPIWREPRLCISVRRNAGKIEPPNVVQATINWRCD